MCAAGPQSQLLDLPEEVLINILSCAPWTCRRACRAFLGLHDASRTSLQLRWHSSDAKAVQTLRAMLSRLPRLVSLACHDSKKLTLFPGEVFCPTIRTLDLSSNLHLKSISSLTTLTPSLVSLNLCTCKKFSDISALASCTLLEALTLSNTAVSDISPLSGCVSLRHLDVSYISSNLDDGVPLDISALAACLQLVSFNLDQTGVLSISPLMSCQHLTRLLAELAFDDSQPLAHLVQLQHLKVRGCEELDLTAVGSCVQLTYLDFVWCSYMPSIAPIASCTKLKDLLLSECSELVDLNGLASCVELTRLMCNCPSLVDISALASCVNLQELDLRHCESLIDIGALSSCVQLRELDLVKTGVADVSPLAAMPHLEMLNLSDSVVTVLTACPCLKWLFVNDDEML